MPKQHRSGTIILEILIATFLIGVSVIALYMAMIFGYTTTIRAHHYTRASQVASQEMEVLRSMDPATIPAPYMGPFLGTTDPVTDLPYGTADLFVSYYNSPTNTIKRAQVVVGWTEKGVARMVEYNTLITEDGLYQ